MVQLKVNIHKLEGNVRYKFEREDNIGKIFSGKFLYYGNENGNATGRLFFSDVQYESDNNKCLEGVLSIPKKFINNIYVVSLIKGLGEINHVINSY